MTLYWPTHMHVRIIFASMWRRLVSVITTHFITVRCIFITKCGIMRFLCAMCVFEVWTSSSSPRLPLCQILFFSHSLTQSINQSPSLLDAPGTCETANCIVWWANAHTQVDATQIIYLLTDK